MKTIYLTVADTVDRELSVSDANFGFAGENNIVTIIVNQPVTLNKYNRQIDFSFNCGNKAYKPYVDITGRSFKLPEELAIEGTHQMQIVYTNDYGEEKARTSQVSFRILPSIEASEELIVQGSYDGTSSGNIWRPDSDWWDIETMVNTAVLEWNNEIVPNIRFGYLVSDSNSTINLASGYEYYLSDGTHYDVDSSVITHAWDISKDKECSDGCKTRAVIVCGTSRDAAISHRAYALDGADSMYIYLGDCNLTGLTCNGTTQLLNANRTLQAIEISDRTTSEPDILDKYALRCCHSLEKIVLPKGLTILPEYAFYQDYALKEAILPDIEALEAYAFWSCTSLAAITLPKSLSSVKAAFNCCALKNVIINTAAELDSAVLQGCAALINVSIPNGYTGSLNISYSIMLSISSIENIIGNYADMTGKTAPVLTAGSTNLAKLSDETKAKAANKNITLA